MKFIAYTFFYVMMLLAMLTVSIVAFSIISVQLSRADDGIGVLRTATVHLTGATGGVVYGKSGKKYILTNWHVCASLKSDDIVGMYDNGKVLTGHVVSISPGSDLCAAVIKDNVPAIKLAKNPKLDNLLTRGYPSGVVTESSGFATGTETWVYEFEVERIGHCPDTAQVNYDHGVVYSCTLNWTSTITTLFSRPGSSGSPVVDLTGGLVGVISSEGGQGNDFCGGMVPYLEVKTFLDNL